MDKLEVKEDIDEIMAEMEEKTPKPSDKDKIFEKFSQKGQVETYSKPISDDVDARGFNLKEEIKSVFFSSKPEKPGHKFPSKPTNERYYDFTNDDVGLALIFNQVNFKGEKERKGSLKDAEDLKEVLSGIGFKAEIFTDFTIKKIENLLLSGWSN